MSYPWPASAISEDEMALLFRAREASVKHMPITELLRRAVIQTYDKKPHWSNTMTNKTNRC